MKNVVVTKQLQDPALELHQVRMIFDEVICNYPTMKDDLKANGKNVQCPKFESGICKVIHVRGELNLLDEEEKQFFEPFKVPPSPLDAEDDSNLTIVQRAFKKRKIASNTQYLDLTYIPPTSNDCERLFSLSR